MGTPDSIRACTAVQQVRIDKLEYYTKVYEGNIEGNIARSTPTDTPDKNTQKSPANSLKL